MRRFLAVFVAIGALSCNGKDQVCCEGADRSLARLARSDCKDGGGEVLAPERCDEIGNPDDIDTDEPDDTLDDTPIETDTEETDADTPERRCADFCAGILEVCPNDTECEHSCLTYATEVPSDEAITCADDAQTCQETGTCWNLLGL